jgi:asparagine synthase (glutamine-hydrolysing)
MSRIAGIVGRDASLSTKPVHVMGAAQRPEAEGAVVSVRTAGRAAFAFTGRRASGLAVEGPILVALDGVLYNRAEVAASHEDPVASDAELFAHSYSRRGLEETLIRANGDFAVAIYDSRDDTLWLARDRFGVRPMYYTQGKDYVAFASRIRALLKLPDVPRSVNRRFVACFAGSHYRTFDNEPASSPYLAIVQLPAAFLARVHGRQVTVRRYWTLTEEPDMTEPEEVLAERYRELLLDAVRIRLSRAEAPAFTLSGGMDSSSVLACATNGPGCKQIAYSTVYEDATYDESAEIRTILDAAVSSWIPVPVENPDLASVLPRMIEANDEPVATATWLSHFLLCQRAHADGIRTLFGGLGGDELNAGEYEYFFYFFADLRRAGDEARLTRETERWVAHHNHPIYVKTSTVMEAALDRLVDLRVPGKCLPDGIRLGRYADVVSKQYFDLHAFVPVMDAPFTSYLKNRTYQDIYRETTPCCLRAADRQAGAFGICPVWPFFDHRLVELMFRVPGILKIRDGVTKHLLRTAMRNVLPDETRLRVKKTGWNAPAHIWFAGPGREFLMDLVGSAAFQRRGIYDVARVLAIINEHDTIVREHRPAENHMMFLWQLVNLELWLRTGDPEP